MARLLAFSLLLILCSIHSMESLRIYQDFSLLQKGVVEPKTSAYLKEVLGAAVNYWNGALSRVYPISERIRLKTASSFERKWLCEDVTEGTLPWYLATSGPGVYAQYDHVHLWSWRKLGKGVKTETEICYYSEDSYGQPLVTLTHINPDETWTNSSTFQRESDIYRFMHELAHALGWTTYDMQNNWLNPNTSTPAKPVLQGLNALTTVFNVGGETYTNLQTTYVRDNIRQYHGCSGARGLVLENHQARGSAGDISAAFYPFELMSGAGRWGQRVTNITLMGFKDSGWYNVNFNYAEPSHFGRNSGCNWFLSELQNNNNFPRAFCNKKGREECDFYGRYNGWCQTYERSHSAMVRLQKPSETMDCWDDARPRGTYFNNITRGSGCFMGALNWQGSAANRKNYCFQFTCSATNQLSVSIRGQTYACPNSRSTLNIPGYGSIECPDPIQYCTVTQPYCPRNCHGQGACNQTTGTCTCYKGHKGYDCSFIDPMAD